MAQIPFSKDPKDDNITFEVTDASDLEWISVYSGPNIEVSLPQTYVCRISAVDFNCACNLHIWLASCRRGSTNVWIGSCVHHVVQARIAQYGIVAWHSNMHLTSGFRF